MLEERAIGPPGTGKTTFLSRVLGYNAQEYGADRVMAVSFTRAAAAELVGRDTPVPPENIGTLHHFAFAALDKPPLAQSGDLLRAFGEEYPQWETAANRNIEDFEFGTSEGDDMLAEYSRLRNLCLPRERWPLDVARFATAWDDYKAQTESIDFCDMIEIAATDTDSPLQEPAVMVVDECQDTSRLQWRLINRWAAHPDCEKLVTAGDVDQCIFAWAGADADYLLDHQPDRRKVLEQSYRVPRSVHAFATAWIQQVSRREDVTYLPRDYNGEVLRTAATTRYPEPILWDIEQYLAEGKSVMVQASCGYMLRPLLTLLRREAIPFSNPWRRQDGSWNPLFSRNENSTVGGVLAFLRPHTVGEAWDKPALLKWLELTKGVLKRGGRELIGQYLADQSTPEEVLDTLANQLQDENDLSRLLAPPPDGLDWLQENLKAAKVKPAEYPLRVARQRGVACLQEEPRLYIGTCHSFKGAEADVVIVFPDLSFQGYQQWVSGSRDEIVRLFYVAATRARETLVLGMSTGMGVWS